MGGRIVSVSWAWGGGMCQRAGCSRRPSTQSSRVWPSRAISPSASPDAASERLASSSRSSLIACALASRISPDALCTHAVPQRSCHAQTRWTEKHRLVGLKLSGAPNILFALVR
eukprot:2476240-Rhodomonas_salina.7